MKPHEILEIPVDASEEDAVRAYKRLAQRLHPDRPGGSLQQFQQLAAALRDFQSSRPCTVCNGRGYTEQRVGMAVKRTSCPKCWALKE